MTTNPSGERVLATDVAVGARVHQTMFLKRISQTKLAPKLGISQSVLSKKLRGSVPWSVTELIRVAEALQVSPADLLPEVRLLSVTEVAGLSDVARPTGAEEECAVRDLNPEPAGLVFPFADLGSDAEGDTLARVLPLIPGTIHRPRKIIRPGDWRSTTRGRRFRANVQEYVHLGVAK